MIKILLDSYLVYLAWRKLLYTNDCAKLVQRECCTLNINDPIDHIRDERPYLQPCLWADARGLRLIGDIVLRNEMIMSSVLCFITSTLKAIRESGLEPDFHAKTLVRTSPYCLYDKPIFSIS